MRDLIPADSLGDFQYFLTAGFSAERLVQARATLFDISEVERGGIGDDLDVVGVAEISIGDRDGRAIGYGDGLGEGGAEVRVRRAAVTDEPAGIHIQVHEVGETTDILRTGRPAAL